MSKTELHIGGAFEDSKRRVLNAVAAAEAGPFESQTHITFESWAALARVMTPKRFEILRRLHGHPAASVAGLARELGRDYKRVHADVEALTDSGLLEREGGGIRTRFDELRATILL
jgi:predicted transcriptional regulator